MWSRRSRRQVAIGYADASQAGDLGVAKFSVGEDYVDPRPRPPPRSSRSTRGPSPPPELIAIDLGTDHDRGRAYPIVLTSCLMACRSYSDADRGDLVKAYMSYIVKRGTGPEAADEHAGCASLPSAVARKRRTDVIDGIEVRLDPDQPVRPMHRATVQPLGDRRQHVEETAASATRARTDERAKPPS